MPALLTTAPVDEFIPTEPVMRVVVTHNVGAAPNSVAVTLIREESGWRPDSAEPEHVDIAVGSATVPIGPSIVEALGAVNSWLISHLGLQARPGSWRAHPTTGTNFDVYVTAVAVAAVPSCGEADSGAAGRDALRFELVRNVLAAAHADLLRAQDRLQGSDLHTATQIAPVLEWLSGQLRGDGETLDVTPSAIPRLGMTGRTPQRSNPTDRSSPSLDLPAARRALDEAQQLLSWSPSRLAGAASEVVMQLRRMLAPSPTVAEAPFDIQPPSRRARSSGRELRLSGQMQDG
ncbi:hypothetical protein [Mycolicibacterium fortuitum]|uniref:hypothetical protein n=1 Tax=Mycolicibacterium fortuitum TaxID=1766 RepID=UPI002614C788|nr:hypothetical protein [Mycolicibacterium fortuitum]